ncbi:MAG: GAF domain-containing protein [Desulfamplus sp.]|nr:GAF domain-containing protein [Desulfamplus sp.]
MIHQTTRDFNIYLQAARKKGIVSILYIPIMCRGNVIGVFRIYTSENWKFVLENLKFVQTMVQMTGRATPYH